MKRQLKNQETRLLKVKPKEDYGATGVRFEVNRKQLISKHVSQYFRDILVGEDAKLTSIELLRC